MLYFIEKSPFKSSNNEYHWHINEKKPVLSYACIEVQADMDELAAIKAQFSNLPIVNGQRSVTWKGEMAQFIYDNLSEKHDKNDRR